MKLFLKKLLMPRQVELENRILSIANETKEFLSEQDLRNIKDDIEYNEFGSAFETLCIQLSEYKAIISSVTYSKIESLGKDIGVNENIWNSIKVLMKNDY